MGFRDIQAAKRGMERVPETANGRSTMKLQTTPPLAWGKIPQAAAYCGVSPNTIRSWMKDSLKYTRLPSGMVLIRFADIDEYFNQFQVDEKGRLDKMVTEIMKGLG
jgi:hypothetical protein